MTFQPIGNAAARAVEQIAKAMQEDAEKLAARYSYDVPQLWYQYQRRCFGSFATTLAGSANERDRYFRAWKHAFMRRQECTEKVAEIARAS